MPALDNPRHERFCQLLVKPKPDGSQMSATEAYLIVTGCDKASADANSWRLMDNEGVRARVNELQERTTERVILNKAEALAGLTSVWTTPIGQVDESSPLAQKIKRNADGSTEVQMVDKLGAMQLLAKMMGWTEEKTVSVTMNLLSLKCEWPQDAER